jgi:hypothetical protein
MINLSRIGIGRVSCPWDDEEPIYRNALQNQETYPSSTISRRKISSRTLTQGHKISTEDPPKL